MKRNRQMNGLEKMNQLNLPPNHTFNDFEEAVKRQLDLMSTHTVPDSSAKELSRRLFLVHGRNEPAKRLVQAFLEQAGLEVVVLADRPNRGRTIIEKFEQESDVGYAIVLATPDDAGKLQGSESEQSRARQNVIFELGYFVGSLGRAKVCLLTDPSVEIPSDFFGVGFVPFNIENDSWKSDLVRELKAAGIEGKWIVS